MAFTLEITREEQHSAMAFAISVASAVTPLAKLRPVHAQLKTDGTPVTEIDQAVEREIRKYVELFRHDDESVLGEEYGADSESGRFWVVDPTDGTELLANGEPGYVISIAYVVRGTPQVALVLDPNTGERWYATLGTGAWWRSGDGYRTERLYVNQASELTPVDVAPATREHYWQHVVSVVENGELREMPYGSMIRAAMSVASGELDGLIYGRTSPWDVAAAALIVVEAKGAYSDLGRGVRQLDRETDGAVFANPVMYQKIMDVIEGDR
jgi:histidinol-phosphatase